MTDRSAQYDFDLSEAKQRAEVRELERRLSESEELREAVIAAAVQSAVEREALETRLALYQAVVSAAQTFLEDPTSVNALFALAEATAECPVME